MLFHGCTHHHATEISLQSSTPDISSSDLIIKTSIKKSSKWETKKYPFVFRVGGEKYIKTVKGVKKNNSEGILFFVKTRFRLVPGKHTIMFDSLEKLRPFVAEVTVVGGKTHVLEFKPVYISSEEGFKDSFSEYEARLDGKKIPIRYKRFNLH